MLSRRGIVALGVGAFGALAVLCIARHAPAIASQSLAAAAPSEPAAAPPPQAAAAPAPAVSPQPPAAPALEEQVARVLAGRTIEFETASDVLTLPARQALDEIAPLLAAARGVTVEIAGHTDRRGSEERNLTLSQRRAETVRGYLIDKGVASGMLTAVGHGSRNPMADDSTAQGMRRNRRIEFEVRHLDK
jgi:outer membrane protein OmpA-like peptidoglycan-associated protein